MSEYLTDSFSSALNSVVVEYMTCIGAHATGLPFLQLFEKQIHNSSSSSCSSSKDAAPGRVVMPIVDSGFASEQVCWSSLESSITGLVEMVTLGEDTGVYSRARLTGYGILLVYQWLVAARQFLTVSYHWGDMQM